MPTMKFFTLLKSDTFEEDFFKNYAKFKHGSKTQAREFGKLVASICEFEENSSLVFYPAPSNNIPTASNAFKDYLLSNLTSQIVSKKLKIKQGKINRQYSYDEEYSLMSAKERLSKISDDMLHIDKSFIEATDTLVFIDDIKITGSHEKHIKDLLKRQSIKNNVIFIYIANYTGSDPTIENRLNNKYVTNLKDINDIIRNEEFIFNTRVVKYILRADIEEFISFIMYQSGIFRETLFNLAVLNDYHTNIKYKRNFNILKDI